MKKMCNGRIWNARQQNEHKHTPHSDTFRIRIYVHTFHSVQLTNEEKKKERKKPAWKKETLRE